MYTKAIVTFIDILGFREMVSTEPFKELKRKIDLVTHFAMPPARKGKHKDYGSDPKVIQFSDSIIRVRPIDSTANKKYQSGILFHELLDLVHAQGDLINNGVLLRGGIAIGDVYIKGKTIFGPAFIQAYDIESKLANHPRIVISPDIIKEAKFNKLLRSQNNNIEDELQYLDDLAVKGDDGIWFVDYCRAFQTEVDEPEYYMQFLKRHKNLIITNGKKLKSLTSVSAKYMWLANYHNASILKTIKPEFIESENLAISEDEFHLLGGLKS